VGNEWVWTATGSNRRSTSYRASGPARWVEYHHETAAPSTHVFEFVWDHEAPAIGPFCTDVDGNVLMDWTGQVGAMPLGYNNPKIMEPLEEFDLVDP